MQSDLKEYNEYLQKQIVKDIDARSLNGTYIYLATWLLIGGATGFYVDHFVFYLSFSAVLFVQGVMRFATYWYFTRVSPNSKIARTYWQYINTLLPALVFSLLLSLVLYFPEFNEIFFYLLLTIFALLSAGTINFAPIKKLSVAYVLALTMLPFATATFFTSDRVIEGLMLVLYASYMVILAIRLNKEYLLNIQQRYTLDKINQQDSLTGIANRRRFDEVINSSWKSGLRSKSTLCLFLIDIDFFKQVNDKHGHAAGDEVIKNIATIIQSVCRRESDLIARIGGEEYAILFENYDTAKIQFFAEKIRNRIASKKIKFDGLTISVTASFGVAYTQPSLEKTSLDLFKVADKNLYAAKEAGRNRVIISEY